VLIYSKRFFWLSQKFISTKLSNPSTLRGPWSQVHGTWTPAHIKKLKLIIKLVF